jgi:thioredoxin
MVMKYLPILVGIMFSFLNAESVMQNEVLSKVTNVTSNNFKSEVENYQGNVIVDVHAVWCGPCKKMKPIFEVLSAQYPGVKFTQLDSDQAKEIAQRFNVTGLPTFLFFKDGKLVGTQKGYMDSEGMKGKIKEYFGQ